MTVIMWFRRDLRTEDNKALAKALASGQPILAVFHINPDQLIAQKTANQTAFFQSLAHFRDHLAAANIDLYLMSGDWEACFSQLVQQVPDWTAVYFNYDEAGFGRLRDQKAAAFSASIRLTFMPTRITTSTAVKRLKTNSANPIRSLRPIIEPGRTCLRRALFQWICLWENGRA